MYCYQRELKASCYGILGVYKFKEKLKLTSGHLKLTIGQLKLTRRQIKLTIGHLKLTRSQLKLTRYLISFKAY